MAGKARKEGHAGYMAQQVRDMEWAYRQAMAGWIRESMRWDYFVTITFDPWAMGGDLAAPRSDTALPPAVSRWNAQRRFESFLQRAPRALGRPADGVVALELHKSGQPHGHGLLSVSGGPLRGDVVLLGRDWRGRPGNGYIRIERPRSEGDVAGYCAKYMAKEDGELVFSPGLADAVGVPGPLRWQTAGRDVRGRQVESAVSEDGVQVRADAPRAT